MNSDKIKEFLFYWVLINALLLLIGYLIGYGVLWLSGLSADDQRTTFIPLVTVIVGTILTAIISVGGGESKESLKEGKRSRSSGGNTWPKDPPPPRDGGGW